MDSPFPRAGGRRRKETVMPLPLIPVLLGGASLAAGAFGVKKALEAKENFETAEYVTDSARNLQEEALQQLEKVRKQTQQSLENLAYA